MIVNEIKVKDYLTKSKLDDYTINPYIGCTHACKYCYACFMKRFTGHKDKWGEFVDVKLCDKPIDIKKLAGKTLFLSSVTDCYNHLESKYEVTRKILTQLIAADAKIQISTKNKLILRDLDILKQLKNVTVALSVNTLDETFRKDMDRASTIDERLFTLKTLHENGIKTVLFMSPIFMGLTDYKGIIERTKTFIDEYWFEDLNLRGEYKYEILDYIKTKHPQLYPYYQSVYVEGNRRYLEILNKKIIKCAQDNGVKYQDYFHHADVIKREMLKSKNLNQ